MEKLQSQEVLQNRNSTFIEDVVVGVHLVDLFLVFCKNSKKTSIGDALSSIRENKILDVTFIATIKRKKFIKILFFTKSLVGEIL